MTRLITVHFIIDCTPLRKIHRLQHQDFGAIRQIKGDQSATEFSHQRKNEIAPETVWCFISLTKHISWENYIYSVEHNTDLFLYKLRFYMCDAGARFYYIFLYKNYFINQL